jgi:hypothetical protein
MGMSTHVVFLRDGNDEEHQKKVKVLKACIDANVAIPKEILDYFDGSYDPDVALEINFKAREWGDHYRSGYEVDLDEIPEGVKTIRFYNSW